MFKIRSKGVNLSLRVDRKFHCISYDQRSFNSFTQPFLSSGIIFIRNNMRLIYHD